MKGILVGYESESGDYRIYHPQKRKVVVSRDLIICEDEFAYAENKPVSQFKTPSGTRPTVDKIEGPSRSEARPILDEIEAEPLPTMNAPEPDPAIPAPV